MFQPDNYLYAALENIYDRDIPDANLAVAINEEIRCRSGHSSDDAWQCDPDATYQ